MFEVELRCISNCVDFGERIFVIVCADDFDDAEATAIEKLKAGTDFFPPGLEWEFCSIRRLKD